MIFDNFACQEDTPEAYETLLLEALLGDLTLFMRSDQVEEAWDVVKLYRSPGKITKIPLSLIMKPEAGPEDSMELVKDKAINGYKI